MNGTDAARPEIDPVGAYDRSGDAPVRYLSVCSGIEAATVAWHPLGFQPLAFSEIDPFARAVLTHHYPDVPLHGDFTLLRDEDWIAGADILVGGTPCQGFSIAGLRRSLDDERGNLSLEFVRLAHAIDALRLPAGQPPAIIIWENVPGVLSVRDNAFGCFLSGLSGEDTPVVPPRGKWTNAGVALGPARAVAWRILDAQYFGLAQRRRRVFVVASARAGFDPAAVLLEFEGLRRDSPPRREAREVAPTIPSRGTAGGGLGTDFDCDGGVIRSETRGQNPVVAVAYGGNKTTGPLDVATAVNGHGGPHGRLDFKSETFVTYALRAEPVLSHQNPPAMAVRRLTPKEAERLQGFPDGYTNLPWRGKAEAPDGPRYKALGNSMAVPVMAWIGRRIKQALEAA